MIETVQLHRFKRFRDIKVSLLPDGVSLVVGGNNSGKSSLLQGLAVWEFARTVLEMEKGQKALLQEGASVQGVGLGDDEFSPVNVPSLKHLWTNLRTQKQAEPDGYTLKIACSWKLSSSESRTLEFGLSLANDRLFVKPTSSNLQANEQVPRIAYLPPFAGIEKQESLMTPAMRQRLIGQGLSGAVLRNLLLDLQKANMATRAKLKAGKAKIKEPDLRQLREDDPWERLLATLRDVFSVEVAVEPFNEAYHTHIRANVYKVKKEGARYKKEGNYNARDIMVEGSGFLQWLSVYALAVNPDVDVLLLDEPDAHLHTSLQTQLFEGLQGLAHGGKKKQVLIATHSTEILKGVVPTRILEVKTSSTRYLSTEEQKVGLFAGLGSEYAPRIDQIKRHKRVLFVEGEQDIGLLKIWAKKLNLAWPTNLVLWTWASGHKERKHLFLQFKSEIAELKALSLRDRDDEAMSTVDKSLVDQIFQNSKIDGFLIRKWRRRHIENYLLCAGAIARAANVDEVDIKKHFRSKHALVLSPEHKLSEAPETILDARGKEIFTGSQSIEGIEKKFRITRSAVAKAMYESEVCEDVKTLLDEITRMCA